jgi:hypothetical protein
MLRLRRIALRRHPFIHITINSLEMAEGLLHLFL